MRVAGELLARADDHAVRGASFASARPSEHVERLGRGDADAAALADGEVVVAVVAPDHGAVAVHDLARAASRRRAVAAQERAPAEAGDEAEVLALALVGHRQAGVARELAHLAAW